MAELLYKELTFNVIDSAMDVHRILGSGFLEGVYQMALAHGMRSTKIDFMEQKHLPIEYRGEFIGDYIADFVVEEKLIVEIKTISRLNATHQAQALHYLTATGMRLTLLLNFGASSLQPRRVIK